MTAAPFTSSPEVRQLLSNASAKLKAQRDETALFKALDESVENLEVGTIQEIVGRNALSSSYHTQNIKKYQDLAYLRTLNAEQLRHAQQVIEGAFAYFLAAYKEKSNKRKLKQRSVFGKTIPNKALSSAAQQITQCADILSYLKQGIPAPEANTPEAQHNNAFFRFYNSDNCLAYLARTVIEWLRDTTFDALTNPTVASRTALSTVNAHRLYWIWGKGFLLDCILSELPDILNKTRSTQEINAPNVITGYMSFILYYTRLFAETVLLFKHVVPGWWMSEAEKQKGWKQRLAERWDEKGIVILNDLVWSTTNLVTYFWLTSSQSARLGNYGIGLTALLLCFDAALTFYAWSKNQKKFERAVAKIDGEIIVANKELSATVEQLDETQEALTPYSQETVAALNESCAPLFALLDKIRSISDQATADALLEVLKTTKVSDYQRQIKSFIEMENELSHNYLNTELQTLDDFNLEESSETIQTVINETVVSEQNSPSQELMAHILNSWRLHQRTRRLSKRLESLNDEKAALSLDWKYQSESHQDLLVYSIAMMASFSLLLLPLIPGLPIAASMIGFASSLLLFSVSVAYTYKTYHNKVARSEEERAQAKQQCAQLLIEHKILQAIEEGKNYDKLFLELIKLGEVLPEGQQRQKAEYYHSLKKDSALPEHFLKLQRLQLFLEIRQLQANDTYHQGMIRYQRINLMRAVVTDCIIPVIVFAATFCFPLGIGLGILAAGLVVGLILPKLIDYCFTPKEKKLGQGLEHKTTEELLADPDFIEFDNNNPSIETLPAQDTPSPEPVEAPKKTPKQPDLEQPDIDLSGRYSLT